MNAKHLGEKAALLVLGNSKGMRGKDDEEDGDNEEIFKEQADELFKAIKANDKEAFAEALMNCMHAC